MVGGVRGLRGCVARGGLRATRLPRFGSADPGSGERGKVILIVAVPLVGALLAIGTIVVRLGRARDGVGVFTWLVLGVLGAFTLLGILTIGVFVAPVTVCLLIATLRIQEAARAS